jgi:hypothetical protein
MDRTDAARDIPGAASDVLDCLWWLSRGAADIEGVVCTFEAFGYLLTLCQYRMCQLTASLPPASITLTWLVRTKTP